MGEELSDYEKEVLLLAFRNTYERLKRTEKYYKVLKKHMTEEEYKRVLEEYEESKDEDEHLKFFRDPFNESELEVIEAMLEEIEKKWER